MTKYKVSEKDLCTIWTKHASELDDISEPVDLVKFYACTLNQNKLLLIPILLIAVLIIFRFMSFISEEYATPALIKFAELLKLPSIVAGVTLIAFANGAGDVITSISSSGDEGDAGFVLSTIYGSGIFS
jgi:sodium/potassium/calcium exchanger 6